ncbi:hypothetical protein LJR225_002613 [Phenylobacterium sp. LjRoot225]|uniref:hypothetical protein n=1 Tax=Phenylobacterium sp. LjRoot225 TaxID=3342285 RepID=UPI003ECD941E
MTRERFLALAQAYGAEIAAWPVELREDAALLAAAEPAFAQAVLARESQLDAALDALPRATASAALYERIVASAPAPRPRWRWRLWLAPAGLSAALAGVAAAGLLVGVQLSGTSSVSPEASAQAVADLDVSTVPEVG